MPNNRMQLRLPRKPRIVRELGKTAFERVGAQ